MPTCPCGVEFAAEVRTPLYPAFTIADAQHQQVAERSPGESGESIPCLCFSVGAGYDEGRESSLSCSPVHGVCGSEAARLFVTFTLHFIFCFHAVLWTVGTT